MTNNNNNQPHQSFLGAVKAHPIRFGLKMAGLAAVVGLTLANTHIIKDTEVGVFVKLGEIQPTVATTGLTFTVPFIEDLRRVGTTEQKHEYSGISLATRADAASPATGNIVITYAINGEQAPSILEEFGTVARFLDSRLNQPMLSQARILASAIEDTRTLMTPEARIELGNSLRSGLDASHTGYSIRNIMVQSIMPHVTIAKRINDAAQRAEDDVIEQHNLTLATSVASTATARAEGAEAVANAQARARAFEVEAQADAKAHAILVQAEAERDGMIAIAQGNSALDLTLTPAILEDKRIAVELEFAKKSKGLMPHTILNGDISTLGVPVSASR